MHDGTPLRWPLTLGALALAAALHAAACAQDDEQESDAPRAAQACLNQPTIRRTRILNDRNIVFMTRDGQIYNNQLPRQCPSLRRGSLVSYPIEQSRLCAGNSFQVMWETSARNYAPAFICQLGQFLPITQGELEDLVTMTERDRSRSGRRRSTREAVTTEQVELPPPEPAPAPAPP
jgi:hypothetical protein